MLKTLSFLSSELQVQIYALMGEVYYTSYYVGRILWKKKMAWTTRNGKPRSTDDDEELLLRSKKAHTQIGSPCSVVV